jgi:hypothetical protein
VGFIPKTTDDIWFPADKLTIIANQPFHGKMTGDMTAQILRFAAKNPDFNQERISEHARVPLGIMNASGKTSVFYSVWPYLNCIIDIPANFAVFWFDC